jgi:hypothetical protein
MMSVVPSEPLIVVLGSNIVFDGAQQTGSIVTGDNWVIGGKQIEELFIEMIIDRGGFGLHLNWPGT